MAMQDSDVIAKLKRIIDEYGISTFSYHAKANALVSDFFPGGENERTRRLIKALIDCDAFVKISKANSGNIDGVCKSIKYVLVDVESLSEERAEIAIGWVCGSMGKRAPSFPPINPAKSNNKSATSNSNNHGTSSSRPIQPTPQNTNNNMGVNQYGQYGIDPNYVVKRKRVRRNVPKPLIICVIAFVVALVGGFSVITLINNNKIDTVENLISALPDDENYYLDYQAEIVDAYAAYMELDEKLQGKVENAGKLMSVMDGLKVAEAYEQRQNMQFTKLDGGGYSVKLKEGANSKISGELVIPGVYRQEPVVTIEDYAFENCRSITSVVVPDSITTIGVGAFKGCSSIQNISLPFIGKSINSTGYESVFGYIFGYKIETSSEYHDTMSTDFVNIKVGAVDGATWQYSCYNGEQWGYTSTQYINSYYYFVPTSLKTVTISNQADIPNAAFNGCKMINSINFTNTSNALGNIGIAAFQNCSGLNQYNGGAIGVITIPSGVQKIEQYAFLGCNQISEIHYPEGLLSIGNYAFQDCYLLSNITVPDTVQSMGIGVYKNCNNINSIEIPFVGASEEAVAYRAVLGYIFGYVTQSTGDYHDSYSEQFVNIKAGNVDGAIWQYSCYDGQQWGYTSTQYLNSYYYYIPSSLKTVVITKQYEVPDGAFNGCSMLVSISIPSKPNSMTTIGRASFQNCKNLITYNDGPSGTITIQENVRYIENYAFSGCEKIESIVYPSKLIRIGEYAFKDCVLLSEIIVPNSVESIGLGSFKGCISLQSMTLPFVGERRDSQSYKSVLGYIFGFETKMTSDYHDTQSESYINIQATSNEDAIWQYSCYNGEQWGYTSTKKLRSYYYYIPPTITTIVITDQTKIPTAAFNGCTMLETITFEKGISNQGEAAFQNCSATVNKGN